MRHATDPDHVVAVVTIVSRQGTTRGAALIGALWGVGHTATIMLVGGAIILFDLAIPPRVGLTMEFGVALMLIVLGILNVARPFRPPLAGATGPGRGPALHVHPHGHGDYVHTHVHGHEPQAHGHGEGEQALARVDRILGGIGGYRAVRPLVVGLVHGLAGSAAIALLVLAAIHDPLWATAYLLLFGAGTIAGMMLITAVIAVPFAYTAARFAIVHRYLGVASGLLSLAVGLFLAYEVGLVDGLFTATPQWTPK
jgi:high-affinity nickel-transport protein